jgi:hypothetical protein
VRSPESFRAYWRKSLTITAMVLFVWIVLTVLVGYHAQEVHEAVSVLYALIIGFYAWYVNKQHGA